MRAAAACPLKGSTASTNSIPANASSAKALTMNITLITRWPAGNSISSHFIEAQAWMITFRACVSAALAKVS